MEPHPLFMAGIAGLGFVSLTYFARSIYHQCREMHEYARTERLFAAWCIEQDSWRIRRAKQIDPRGYIQSLRECYESHITGDCPLCGAE